MKNILCLILFALLMLPSGTYGQGCPASLVCDSLTGKCIDMGNWNPHPHTQTIYVANPYQVSSKATWDSLPGAKSYNFHWCYASALQDPTACNFLAHYSLHCGVQSIYGLKAPTTMFGYTPYNFTGGPTYYMIEVVTADGSRAVTDVYTMDYLNISCLGCQDYCPYALDYYTTLAPASSPTAPTSTKPGKGKGK